VRPLGIPHTKPCTKFEVSSSSSFGDIDAAMLTWPRTTSNQSPMSFIWYQSISHIRIPIACNGILSHCSTADVFVKLSLVKAYCLPVLIYCIGALNLPVAKIKDLGVCWNDCFRKLFGYKRFESVKVVQYFCSELSFDLISELQR